MTQTEQHLKAPVEEQEQSILEYVMKLKREIEDTKIVLKKYKIKSPKLDELKKVKKELLAQINEEKDRIEDLYYEDSDYEKAKNDQLTIKNQITEKASELREIARAKYKPPALKTQDRIVGGEAVKVQVLFSEAVYLNGKELK